MTELSPTLQLACDLISRNSTTPEDAGCQQLMGERLAAGAAILLVTHDGHLAERMGQRRLRIAGGVLA